MLTARANRAIALLFCDVLVTVRAVLVAYKVPGMIFKTAACDQFFFPQLRFVFHSNTSFNF